MEGVVTKWCATISSASDKPISIYVAWNKMLNEKLHVTNARIA